MSCATRVLQDLVLVKKIAQYQDGLPMDLIEITHLAQSVVISPWYTQTFYCPTAYLSNIPARFYDSPYLKLYTHPEGLPNYALFLNDYYNEPTLPLHLSIVENNTSHVKLWIKHKPEWLTPEPLNLAVVCGHLEMVKMLINASKISWTSEAMDLASMNGHIDIVKWMHSVENGVGCTTRAIDSAASYGHYDVVQFLCEHRSEGFTSLALKEAVDNGYSKIVEYLMHRQFESNFDHFSFFRVQCRQANEGKDYLGVLRCLSQPSFPNIHEDSMSHLKDFCALHCIQEVNISAALRENPIATLAFIRQSQIIAITSTVVFDILVRIGNAVAIRYVLEAILHENGKPISWLDEDCKPKPWTPADIDVTPCLHWSSDWVKWKNSKAMDVAAELGDLNTIKLLHRSGIKCCTSRAMDEACRAGRLDIVKWLHHHRTEGCTRNAMALAAAGGHLHVLKWLYEVNRLHCTSETLDNAIANGDIAMVKFLISTPTTPTSRDYYDNVHSFDLLCDLPSKDLSHDYTSTPQAMDTAVFSGHLEMIEYLHKHRNGCCTADAFTRAVIENRLDIMKYLVANECLQGEINNQELCTYAAGGNIDMLMFCMDHFPIQLEPQLEQRMMYKAVCRGLLDNVKWLHEVKGIGSTREILEAAERRGRKRIVHYLKSIGDPQVCVDDELYMYE